MKPRTIFPLHCISITALFLTGLAASAIGQSPAGKIPGILPLGKVTVLGPATCPGGATKGATCTSINVACPGIPDLTAILSQAIPTGTARGTVILHSGSGGTTFFNSGFGTPYLNDGFRVVQLAWTT